jgi:predicted CXXCH cytochrome family protein
MKIDLKTLLGQRLRTKFSVGLSVAATAVLAGITLHLLGRENASWAQGDGGAAPTFVGSGTCANCHRLEASLWQRSQHKRAMDHATGNSVLGNFNNVSFDYYGTRSRFFRKDGKFYVETDGADGKLATFQIEYTFGNYPLQQYLIEFPDGRIQALSIAWDSRPKEQGGQRWFHLYPKENIAHNDVLHWTKLNQNWNHMCAECHSTGVHKNYDAASDRFATQWSEINVGCEACHGAGSRHVAWAQGQKNGQPPKKSEDPAKGLVVRFDERAGASWLQNDKSGLPHRSRAPANLRKEVETCGLCHARRDMFSENWTPGQWLSDTHQVTPLNRSFFFPDGQIRDDEETYNYLPFKQSKMFAAGVTCSDCHNPHSAALRAPGDGVCLQCHLPAKYQSVAHRHHPKGDRSVSCISCHMSARTYMVIDPRHDHSFRVPRPDLSVNYGVPNACSDCHRDKSAQWAATNIETWFGLRREGVQTYAAALYSAWATQADAELRLSQVASNGNVPAVVRASALTELNAFVSPANISLARKGLLNSDPMVRIGAMDMLDSVPVDRLWPFVSPLLSDPIRGVRIKAASALAAMPTKRQPPADRERFERAASEFVTAQQLNADRPGARTALGTFYAQRGLIAKAEVEFTAALRLSPQFTPAAINIADLYRALGKDRKATDILRKALVDSPQDSGLHFSLGLALVRLKKSDEALTELRRAAELAPDQSRYAYVYAVGLHSVGRSEDAILILKENLARHPSDRDTLVALINYNRDAENIASALEYAERLARVLPMDKEVARIIQKLKGQAKK